MFLQVLTDKRPSRFHINPIVQSFVVAETLLWSAWNFFFPLVGVFVVTKINGSNLSIVATAYSIYLMARVISELLSARYFVKRGDRIKLVVAICGSLLLGFGYLLFIVANSVAFLFIIYLILGAGLGISSPAKYSLFSIHLDKNKEANEWSFYDAISFAGMAISGIIGGMVASIFGFNVLFLIASFLNLLGIFPYFFLLKKYPRT